MGRYRVLRPLGAGGMGEVYVAEDERLGRQVALKVIRGSGPLTAAARARFEQEARAASALTHPNIITIYDIGDAGQQPFIVMELLEGRSLRELLQTPMPVADLFRLAGQIADALSTCHERGIVHRDLKPENVFVTAGGNAKVLDFGVARIRQGALTDEDATAEQLTIRGSAIGTVGYMAPEVVAGHAADFRADLFSIGCVLYEMATGSRAFKGSSAMDVLAATLREDPAAVTSVRGDIPARFSAIVETCLRKDPATRYASTAALRDALLAVATAEQTAPRPSERGRTLPRFDFPLLGRDAELAAIRSMIVNEGSRLVTLTGAGGSGKTRLALAAAEQLLEFFAGRVFFVPLASVTEPELVGAAIAHALGAGDPARAPLPAVIASLRSTENRSLLIIDNFEQVIDAAPELADLIANCPTVTILVTSREILHLYAERTLPVPPLQLPETDAGAAAETLGNPAVMLFVQRARAVNPALELDAGNISAIAEICRRLDGLPLAIELAAARTRLITPRAMLGRIGERLKLLTGGARDLPGRQQTLRRTLDWSYELLNGGEQALLRRLSVFAGSFTLEEAEAVADPFGRLEVSVDDGVGSLVDKSLLVRKGEDAGEARFGMLGMVRDYAAEQLAASSEEEETRKAHAAYYVVLAEEGAQALRTGQNPLWMARLAREHDNLRAALEWTTASGHIEWGLRIAVGIFPFWERSEHLSEGRRRLEALLADSRGGGDDLLRARALFATAVLACAQSDYAVAAKRAEESLALHRRANDRGGIAVSCNCLGVVYTELRQLEHAAANLEESLSLWKSIGDDASYARSLTNLAVVRRLQGNHTAAREMYIETEALFRRIRDGASAAWALNHQGDVARELGDLDQASHYYASALRAFRDLGDSWGIASSLVDTGNLARRHGQPDHALAAYSESLEHFRQLGHTRGIARVLEAMAVLAVALSRYEQALTLAGAASRLRDLIGTPLPEPEQQELDAEMERARGELPSGGAGKSFQCGRCMGVAEAIAYAAAEAQAALHGT